MAEIILTVFVILLLSLLGALIAAVLVYEILCIVKVIIEKFQEIRRAKNG